MQLPDKKFRFPPRFLKNTGRRRRPRPWWPPMVPQVHAADNNTIQMALIGCGGRGSGAAGNAISRQTRSRQARGHG